MTPAHHPAPATAPLMVRTRPILPFVISLLLASLWLGQLLGAYTLVATRDRPDHVLLTWMLIPFCLWFLGSGIVHARRRLIIRDGILVIGDGFRQTQIPLAAVGAISLRYRQIGRSVSRVLEVWGPGEQPTRAARLNLAYFSRASLAQVMDRLRHDRPSIAVDREVLRYVGR